MKICLTRGLTLYPISSITSGCDEPPVDFKTKVPFWPGLSWPVLAWPGQNELDVSPCILNSRRTVNVTGMAYQPRALKAILTFSFILVSHDVPGSDEQVAPSPFSPFSPSSPLGRAAAPLVVGVGGLCVVECGECVCGREVADEGGVVARGHRAEQLGAQVVLESRRILILLGPTYIFFRIVLNDKEETYDAYDILAGRACFASLSNLIS